ncbi:PQQ-dependent sugar dehydrogenase [Fodinicola feengrottensis]|uniref:PQQ-dependent sugar dehydrogenase n=1 Tax=Fodinicola feengrottensis TaxID=435914 RepID=A0ABN2H8A0_9ACTN
MPASPRLRTRTRAGVSALTAGVLVFALAGCAFGPPGDTSGEPPNLPTPTVSPTPSPSQSPTDDGGLGVQVLVKNLAVPWGMAFLPDKNALVTERDSHRILKVAPNGATTTVQTLKQVAGKGEGGLLGIAVSPKYATDKTVFIYYSTASDNRIAKLVLGGQPQPIVTGIPVADHHDGGRLAIGPDGYLYAGTGDAGTTANAQNTSSLGGKILRMTLDGKPAPGNPFPNSLVYSYGHRNVEGLAWDAKNRLYATEFGQDKFDELNLIQPGKNYGWPTVEGTGQDPKFVNPLQTWPTSQASPAGLAIAGNNAVLGALTGKCLWVVGLDASTGQVTGKPQDALKGQYGRLRTVMVAPDGSLWVTTSNKDGRGSPAADDDKILRVVPPGGGGVSQL